ncbi:MAG: D-alanyl-D-alanine carboxypeptidase family protein [Solirubrobacteraceae bacterium]
MTRAALAVLASSVALAGLGAPSAAAAPGLNARSAALIEESTGQRLFGRAPDARVPIASTTKLMTALLTLEHVRQLSATFTQNRYYSAPGDSQIGLVPGERMSVHDLLLALLLPSADDAAEDLAFHVGHGSLGRFIGMMNARARQLGLTRTHYSTPIGLDTPANYSSASDLTKLASFVLTHSRFFARAVALPRAVLRTGSHTRVVANRNDLLRSVPWINGVKTGHTRDAGYVLVGSGTRDGMTLISAVLGTSGPSSRDANTLALLGYGFRTFHLVTPVRAGEVLARPTVRDRPGVHATVIAASAFTDVLARSSRVGLRVQVPHQLAGPLKRHAVVGSVTIFAGPRKIARIPLLLARALPAVSPLTLAAHFLTRGSTLLFLVVLLALAAMAYAWRGTRREKHPAGPEAA